MTSTRYVFCRLAQTFGYNRKNIRMSDAAAEMHLLKEAEAFLGKAVWREVEHIEELSVEYWNLRKLVKERERVASEVETCEKYLAEAHEERASLLGVNNEPFQDLVDERQNILNELENHARDRDLIVAKAREIRRIYDGIKMKREVLEKEGTYTPEELKKISERLETLKIEFAELKARRQAVAQKIAIGDDRIDAIELELKQRKKDRRNLASEAFQHIGETNQRMSTLRAEIGLVHTQMRQLYSEIGRHVSRNAATSHECAKACKEQRGLVDVMAALRHSVLLNHKLAENS